MSKEHMVDPDSSKQPSKFQTLSSPKHLSKKMRRLEKSTLRHAHTFIFKRWENVQEVRRHALSWLLLVGVLIGTIVTQTALTQGLYRASLPKAGGTFAEGALGTIETLNPLFASSPAEQAASRLIYSGLMTYDIDGKLLPDLAESVKLGKGDTTYTVVLKPRLLWHDGAPLTSRDVMFTFDTIKNAAVGSPLYAAWNEVSVTAPTERTVVFSLPAPFAPFSSLLTQAIIPAHSFEDVPPNEIRNAQASLNPNGSGPFSFRSLQTLDLESGRKTVHLAANPNYYGGAVQLERFQLHAYPDREDLRRGMATGEINAAAGLTTEDLEQPQLEDMQVSDLPLNSVVLAIFKTNQGLMAEKPVRQALRLAINREKIIEVLNNRVLPLEVPIPPSMTSGLDSLKQPAFSLKTAGDVLQKAGWKLQDNGKRTKKGKPLQINVATLRTGDYPRVLEEIIKEWAKLGVTTQTTLVEPDNAQQSVLEPRAYDVLIYEMEIEGDPDVYAYWHSSRATSSGLNLANYKSDIVDDALTSARARSEPELRSAKYQAFARAWLSDVPAVALYRPTLHYVSNTSAALPNINQLPDATSRYSTVANWTILNRSQNNTP